MKILFTSTHETSFINEDLRLLRTFSDVERLFTRGFPALPRILTGVLRADVTYTWFASVYAGVVVGVARLAGRKSIVVVGGVDAARLPEIGYGIWLSRWKALFVRQAVVRAEKVLVVDASLRENLVQLARYDGANIEVIPTGYDPAWWSPAPASRKTNVLTVAACDTEARMKVKGLPWLLRVAGAMPGVQFTVVGPRGRAEQLLRAAAPVNVTLVSTLSPEDLRDAYRQAKVFCLPSAFEGLPSSLCEAMLCGCIPVATGVGGTRHAVGETGFVVPYGDSGILEGALLQALALPDSHGEAARRRIVALFPREKREQSLKRILGVSL